MNRHKRSMRRGRAAVTTAAEFMERLEPRQLLAADLGFEVAESFNPLTFYTPGDTLTVPVVLKNNNPDAFTGQARVTARAFRLDGNVREVDPRDTLVASVVLTGLASDAQRAVSMQFPVTQNLFPGVYEFEFVTDLWTPNGQSQVDDEFMGDNTATVANLNVNWAFGTLQGRTGVQFSGVDADGTRYRMFLGGPGSGVLSPIMNPNAPTQITVRVPDGPPGTRGLVQSNTSLNVVVTGQTGMANAFVDLSANIDIALQSSVEGGVERAPLIASINAPTTNLIGSLVFASANNPNGPGTIVGGVTGALTLRNVTGSFSVGQAGTVTLGDFALNEFSQFGGDVGSFRAVNIVSDGRELRFNRMVGSLTAGDLSGAVLRINGSVVSARLGNLSTSLLHLGSGATFVSVGNVTNQSSIFIQNSVASLTVGDVLGDGSVTVAGDATTVTARDIFSSGFTINGSTASFTARDVSSSQVSLSGPVGAFTVRDANMAAFGIGVITTRPPRSVVVTGGLFTNVTLVTEQVISSLTVSGWVGGGRLTAPAIGTLSTRPTQQGVANVGDFIANVFAYGGNGRPTAINSVNITGTLRGTLYAGGSVGTVQIGTLGAASDGMTAPTAGLVSSGVVQSITIGSAVNGRVWVNQARTATITAAVNNSVFELLAGARFTSQQTNIHGAGGPTVDNVMTWRSGSVGTLNVNIRPNITGFNAWFASSVFASAVRSGTTGRLAFGNMAGNGVNTSLFVAAGDTTSRIERINVTGDLRTASNNRLDFAFRRYPAGQFSMGTPSSNVTIANPNSLPSNGDLLSPTASVAANIFGVRFFRPAVD